MNGQPGEKKRTGEKGMRKGIKGTKARIDNCGGVGKGSRWKKTGKNRTRGKHNERGKTRNGSQLEAEETARVVR